MASVDTPKTTMETNEKQKLFQTAKKNLAAVGYIREKGSFHTEQMLRTLEGVLAIGMQFLYLLIDAVTVKEYMDSIFMTTVGVLVFMACYSFVFKTEKLFFVMDEIENSVNKRLDRPRSKALYEKTNQWAEKIGIFLQTGMVHISVPGFVLPIAFYSYFMYFTTEMGAEAFEIPIPTWFPFDWKNPTGYLFAVLLELRIVSIPLRVIAPLMAFGMAAFSFSRAIADDINGDLNAINESAQLNRSHEEIFKQFSELMQLMEFKRIINDFSDLVQIALVILFLGCTGAICLAMLMIQVDLTQSYNEFGSVVLFESLFCAFWALNLVLVVCEAGQALSDAFTEVEDVLGQIDWYLLPIDVLRMLPPTFVYTQKPLVLEFFGSFSCSREQFKMVMNAGYKYFMVLREFY